MVRIETSNSDKCLFLCPRNESWAPSDRNYRPTISNPSSMASSSPVRRRQPQTNNQPSGGFTLIFKIIFYPLYLYYFFFFFFFPSAIRDFKKSFSFNKPNISFIPATLFNISFSLFILYRQFENCAVLSSSFLTFLVYLFYSFLNIFPWNNIIWRSVLCENRLSFLKRKYSIKTRAYKKSVYALMYDKVSIGWNKLYFFASFFS